LLKLKKSVKGNGILNVLFNQPDGININMSLRRGYILNRLWEISIFHLKYQPTFTAFK